MTLNGSHYDFGCAVALSFKQSVTLNGNQYDFDCVVALSFKKLTNK